MEGAVGGWYEAFDGWYEIVEEVPNPASEEEADSVADADEEEAIHHREMAKLNAAIEARPAKLTRETNEHKASVWAGRRHLGDLIGWKNELIAQEAARRLL
jgi:hypothetical protein